MSEYDKTDYTGQQFGRIKVLVKDPDTRNRWICKCECGKLLSRAPFELKKFNSCGCLCEENREIIGDRVRKHGISHTKLYNTYHGMKARCYNPNDESYKNYGGRGIKICDEWLKDFNTFVKWALENGYKERCNSKEQTIDRIDVNGDYEPYNCRWVSWDIQAKNKTNSIHIEDIDGEILNPIDFNKKHGITIRNFTYDRVRSGLSAEEILSEWNICHGGNYMTVKEATAFYGAHRSTIEKMCRNKTLNSVRIGNRLYIPKGQELVCQSYTKTDKFMEYYNNKYLA